MEEDEEEEGRIHYADDSEGDFVSDDDGSGRSGAQGAHLGVRLWWPACLACYVCRGCILHDNMTSRRGR